MTYGSGSLRITARRVGSRTVLERIRYDGISRCSRAFAHGEAARVVLSQLGPGVVRGDSVTTDGRVAADAHLIVTNQTATRLMGGSRASLSRATWSLEERAVLELIGEPVIALADGRYEATTIVDLDAGSFVLMSDLASVSGSAAVRLRSSVHRAGRELFYDSFDAGAAAPHVVGTFALVGLALERIAPLLAALDRTADAVHDARVGVGSLTSGAFARVLGSDVWSVRCALEELRGAAWTSLRESAANFSRATVRADDGEVERVRSGV